ncbi:MAG: hypothetical protein GY856_31695 [bacterium]|nr:hypothetical protein [bacterium]
MLGPRVVSRPPAFVFSGRPPALTEGRAVHRLRAHFGTPEKLETGGR